MDQNKIKVNCMKCKHFYITWDERHPKGCRYHGFKSAKIPSMVVFESSGVQCVGFEVKHNKI